VRGASRRKGEASRLAGEEAPDERRRARGFDADQFLPQRLGPGAARDHDPPRVDPQAAAEGRECARVQPQAVQRLAVRPQRRQRLVVERGEPMIEKRGSSIREDCGNQLVVGDLSPQDRVPPHRRVEWQGNRLARVGGARGLKQIAQANPGGGVSGVLAVRRIEDDSTTSSRMRLRSGSGMASVSASRLTGTPSGTDVRTAGCLAPTAPYDSISTTSTRNPASAHASPASHRRLSYPVREGGRAPGAGRRAGRPSP
jgi:hypothetical protein